MVKKAAAPPGNKSLTNPTKMGPIKVPIKLHVNSIPNPSPALSLGRISGVKAKMIGPLKPEIASKAIARYKKDPGRIGIKISEMPISKKEKIMNILLFPSLSDKYPMEGLKSIAPIMRTLAIKKATLTGIFHSSMKKVPAQVE